MKKGLILTAGLWLAACTPKTESVCGVYQGTQRLVYIGKKDGIFTDRGTFSADGSIVAVTLSGEEPSYYRLEGGQLRRLDMDMQPVEGPLADYYILKKVKSCR